MDIYEEKIIYGLVIGYIEDDINVIFDYFDEFIKCIDNWAICDIVCLNMKVLKKNQEIGINKINHYLDNSNPWINRVGIVLLLAFYINDNYIDYVLDKVVSVVSKDYYVNMAISWLISICYIKYSVKTIKLLEGKKLNIWIHNKSIQKIIESTRVLNDKKEYLKTLKITNGGNDEKR